MNNTSKSKASWNRKPRIIAIGLGDYTFRDDGVGVHALRRFQQLKPAPCLAVEVGTSIPDTVRMIESAERILAFDAIEVGGPPGSVYVLRVQDIMRKDKYNMLRDMRLIGILQSILHPPTEVVIVGAEPQTIEWGTQLSPTLDFAATVMVSTARKVIAKWNSLESSQRQVDLASIIKDSRFEIRQVQ
ncbi:MAG: hydrogenase maturation protease [Acidobacteria bacterium]|nr:hydrogenase maturation protease [Acidobacteriota bacterium]